MNSKRAEIKGCGKIGECNRLEKVKINTNCCLLIRYVLYCRNLDLHAVQDL